MLTAMLSLVVAGAARAQQVNIQRMRSRAFSPPTL
jgi:hypothetical protein